MRCAKCGTDSPAGNNFCVQCGNALNRLCAKCGAENPPTSNFCGKCGASLAGGAGAAVAPSTRPESGHRVRVVEQSDASLATEGERKTVTALFADIKGSTELEQDLDPEEARAIVDPALKLMIDAVRRYDGYVVVSEPALKAVEEYSALVQKNIRIRRRRTSRASVLVAN